jgi:hypothetical protein
MNIKWDEMSERSQTAAALAIVGMISLGLCGAQFAGLQLGWLAVLGALGFLISVVGLLLLGISWLVGLIVGFWTDL